MFSSVLQKRKSPLRTRHSRFYPLYSLHVHIGILLAFEPIRIICRICEQCKFLDPTLKILICSGGDQAGRSCGSSSSYISRPDLFTPSPGLSRHTIWCSIFQFLSRVLLMATVSCLHLNFFFLIVIYLYIWLCLNCNIGDLAPWPGIEPRLPSLGVRSLSHWATKEVSSL